MNEKSVKVDIDFNEALRRIANTPKSIAVPHDEQKENVIAQGTAKKKTVPSKKKDTV